MQVVAFDSYAEGKARNKARLATMFVTSGLILMAFNRGAPNARYILFLTSFLFLAAALLFAKEWTSYAFGAKGEKLLEKELQVLDDRYLLVRNWVPTTVRETGDIDQILFGPFGALVIEVKTFSVPTKCEGDQWFTQHDNGYWQKRKSLSSQLRGNVGKVHRCLPGLTTGVLVFNDRADLNLHDPTVQVLRRGELVEHVRALPDKAADATALWAKLSNSQLPDKNH